LILERGTMDKHCTCLDDDMGEDCMRCHRTMLIRDGEEPTKVCDHCAHKMLSEIADVFLNYRPESPDHGSMESNQVFPQGEV
jgi:hypothetical protein